MTYDKTANNTAPPDSGEVQGASLTANGGSSRSVIKGITAVGVAASIGLPTYLRGRAGARHRASEAGFIEDESGNLAVYGIQKLHAAQLAVKEINDGKTLKGAPNIGAGSPRGDGQCRRQSARDQQGGD